MSIEVVENQMNAGGVWIDGIDEEAHLVGKILSGATVGEGDMPPTGQRFKADEQISRAIALVLGVLTGYLSGLWEGR